MNNLQYWLALNSLPDIGPVVARNLLSAFGSPDNIFNMTIAELRQVQGVGEYKAQKIISFNGWDHIKREIEKAEKNNVRMLALDNPDYPAGLKQIHGAPVILYVKGDLGGSDKYAIAIVGSRRSTDYGRQVADGMAYKLASSGLTVVSGMAMGIDTASHKGALNAGGRTIAVLGSGLDVPYPASNRGLMKVIESSGAVISEFPFGTKPNKENFPRRNRIISALSLGVIVIEATLDSGSLITVGYALEQGKDVFAVPGQITSMNSKGTNSLIKKGARLIDSAEEVIDELSAQLKGLLKEDKQSLPGMSKDEKKLYGYLAVEPKHIDKITREINMTTSRALSVLLNLELKGVVRQSEGKHFSLH
jgi:DNA processing protein